MIMLLGLVSLAVFEHCIWYAERIKMLDASIARRLCRNVVAAARVAHDSSNWVFAYGVSRRYLARQHKA